MSAMLQTLRALQDANTRRDKPAILALIAPDLVYHYHVGSKPVVGPDGLSRFLDRYWAMTSELVWRIDHHAESGDKLLVEGYEEYLEAATGRRVAHSYMGIFEFRDGKISGWRDYFEKGDPPPAPAAAAPAGG